MKIKTWYDKLGFKENPLSIKPGVNTMIGQYDRLTSLFKNLEDGSLILLKGEYGSGKTSIMKGIITEYRDLGKLIYYNCLTTENILPFDKLLIGRSNFIKKLFKIKAKNTILLLDEAQNLKIGEARKLLELYVEGYFHSVLFSSSGDLPELKELKKLTKKSTYVLNGLTSIEAVRLIKTRLDGVKLLSDSVIKQIYRLNKSPLALLKNCEDVCRSAFENGREKPISEDVNILKT